LNDTSGLTYCIALIQDRIQRKRNAATRSGLSRISQLLAAAFQTFNAFRHLTLYVSCFCEEGDLLSQWRGYGRAGGGYAIGIQPRPTSVADENPRIVLRKVLYEPKEQEQLIDASISELETMWTHLATRTEDESTLTKGQNKILSFYRREVGDYIWCFKDPAFREEKEWRFSYLTGATDPKKRLVKFRPGPNSIVPYVELDVFKLRDLEGSTLQVCEVICGPTLHPHHSVEAVKDFLTTHGYQAVNVRASVSAIAGLVLTARPSRPFATCETEGHLLAPESEASIRLARR
jgi:DUF2971 family protein